MLLSEALTILQRAECPYLTTKEEWWVEKMLYEKSSTRTDLLRWIIAKLSVYHDEDVDDTVNTVGDVSRISGGSSAPSSKAGSSQIVAGSSATSDKGMQKFLRASGICLNNEMQFVSGDAPRIEQEIVWTRLLIVLKNIGVSPISVARTLMAYFSQTTSSANFLDIFKLASELLPPDLQEEYEKRVSSGKLPKKLGDLNSNLQRIEKAKNTQLHAKSHPIVEADLDSMTKTVDKLQQSAEVYQEIYRHELKQYTSIRPVIPQDPDNVLAQKLGEVVAVAESDILTLEKGLKHRLQLQNLTGEIKSSTSELQATETRLKMYKKDLEHLEKINRD